MNKRYGLNYNIIDSSTNEEGITEINDVEVLGVGVFDEVYDDVKREAAIAWFKETFQDRLNTDGEPVVIISKIYEEKQ